MKGPAPVIVMTIVPTIQALSAGMAWTEKKMCGPSKKAQSGASELFLEATAYTVEETQAEAEEAEQDVPETQAAAYTPSCNYLADMPEDTVHVFPEGH